ncbi:hypothetical protein M2139_001046 [Enterococcus sp. PF1-24]|uniref:hypothetical protein n=1 Tax=unclassified Enterococcus TaxID=2608891 RepID=UPI00247560E6|nr:MULTISPECIES: hypothetical protein [unclassified Enterococcus]MDH6364061.1 hypothetical protein [Enterococcus sp. PFB1-1]MDH6401162.1 hypothetical protein [Enterococcus sp. PF1-24]
MVEKLNVAKVLLDLNELEKSGNYEENIQIFLIKVTKTKSDIYKQEADDQTKRILFDAVIESISQSRFKKREIIDYDPVVSKKNTHELVNVAEYPNIEEMLKKFNDEEYLTSTSGLKENQFHLYLIKILVGDTNYKFIGSFSSVLKLKKKFIFGNFNNTKIDLTSNSNVFGFNKKIELLIDNDEQILINQADAKFESLFKMNSLFSSKAEKILKENSLIKQVFNDTTRKKLIEKVSNGKRMATRLIKITSDSKRFEQTISNISRITVILDDKSHKFHHQVKDVMYDNGELSVPDGEELQLLNAISDAFYQAIISETENVDETRM